MADSTLIDNSAATTQRVISYSSATQSFANGGTDTSYSLDPLDTNDYYRLNLSQRSSLILKLNSLNGDANIALLDSSGNPTTGVLYESINGGTLADAIVTEALEAGTYYIRVYTSDTSVSTNYSFSVNTIGSSRADLLWRNYANGSNALWFMNGPNIAGSAFTTTVPDTTWRIDETGDFDGDGQADYIWRNGTTTVIWLMNGNTYRGYAFLPAIDASWKAEGVTDFDGDSKNDILWRNYATGENAVWLMNGTALKSAISLPTVTPVSWEINGVGDFNRDGRPDLLWRDYANGTTALWYMGGTNNTSIVASAFLPTVATNWRVMGVADFNGDARPDLFWRDFSTGQNAVWYMNNTTMAGSAFAPTVTDMNWRIDTLVTTPPLSDLAGGTLATAFNVGSITGNGIYNDTIGTPSDVDDYYKFTLASNSVLNVTLTGLTSDAILQLIEDKNGDGVISSQEELLENIGTSGGTAEILNKVLPAGIYYVRVTSSSATKSDYGLSFTAANAQTLDLSPVPNIFNLKNSSGGNLASSVNITSSQTVRAYYQIQNTGVNAIPQFSVAFYLSRDNVITPTDLLLSNTNGQSAFTFTNLAAGAKTANNAFVSLVLPNATNQWWGGDQTYYIGMIIDSGGEVIEISEANNTANAAINIVGTTRPDLIGDSLRVTQTTSSPGQPIQLTGAIRNIGNDSTGSQFVVQFYFSNDDFQDGTDYLLGSATFQPIAAKSTANPNINRVTFDSAITDPSKPAYFTSAIVLPPASWEGWRGNGRYYVSMRIDRLRLVPEGTGGRENNFNYGRVTGQYTDYFYIDITGAPTNA